MRYEMLSYHQQDQVLRIDLHGLDIGYPRLLPLTQELRGLCSEIALDSEPHVIVIHWEQRRPVEGLGLDRYLLNADPGGGNLPACAEAIASLDRPVIMAIDGYAVGPVLEMALAGDIRMASPESYFGLPHIAESIIPWDGGTQRLTRVVGKSHALEMILTGRTFNSQEALRIGLVNQLAEGSRLLPLVMEMARKMASMNPLALRCTKEVVLKGMDLHMEQGLRLEADVYFLLHTSKDRTEGIRAFQEKRPPRFVGE